MYGSANRLCFNAYSKLVYIPCKAINKIVAFLQNTRKQNLYQKAYFLSFTK